jgi:hypothetical protein
VAAGAQIRVHYREQGAPILVEAAAIARHPDYRPNAVAERARSIDLALVRTASALPARFAPATLASQPSLGEGGLFVAGYGLSTEGDATTAGVWRGAQLPLTEPYGSSRVLYWLGGPGGRGACQGDSGGPVFDGGGHVTGLVSWTTGAGRSRCGVLTQAIILAPQRGWIDATLAKWGRSANWR